MMRVMSDLSSASTYADITAAYDDNASYAEDGSVTKAKAFVTACRLLIRKSPSENAISSDRLRLDENLRQYRREMEDAQAYIAAYDTSGTGGVTYSSFEEFR